MNKARISLETITYENLEKNQTNQIINIIHDIEVFGQLSRSQSQQSKNST